MKVVEVVQIGTLLSESLQSETWGPETLQLTNGKLVDVATELGLDSPEFSACLDSGRNTSLVTQESLSIQSLGVRGTPAFLVNGVFISGAQPFEVFQQVIEEQLQKLNQ